MTINVLVLMSGPGKAFKAGEFAYPKNLIEIKGKPLIQHVLEGLRPLEGIGARFLCLIPREENLRYHTGAVIRLLMPKAEIIEAREETAGAACSALLCTEFIDNDDPLIVVNGDQIITADLQKIVIGFLSGGIDGGIIVFSDVHPRWSFVKCDKAGHVVEAAEKRPISTKATAGFYFFTKGRDFVAGACGMLKKDANVGGHFYVCPVYNELILDGKIITVSEVSRQDYRSLATPESIVSYEKDL
jgi:dTDP-glucose pyrophosphorylase